MEGAVPLSELAGHESASTQAERHHARSLAGEICTQIVRLTSRYTGRGPTRVTATVNTNLVAVVLQDTLTKGEQNLAAAGQIDAVIEMRRRFHEMMREEAIGIVEGLTGRHVLALLSDIDPNKNVAGQLYILERRPETGVAETVEAAGEREL
jgi:uncharacterized protein YbcI